MLNSQYKSVRSLDHVDNRGLPSVWPEPIRIKVNAGDTNTTAASKSITKRPRVN